MRFVFVGAGNLTVRTAKILIERGHEVVIVEADKERIEQLTDELDCSFLHGDGSNPQVLEDTNPERCDCLFSLSDSDQDNIVAALVARSLGFDRVVPKISDPRFEFLCDELNLEDMIVPDRTIAHYLSDMAVGVDILNLATAIKGDARLFAWTFEATSTAQVKDLELPKRVRVVCYYRNDEFQLADETTELQSGDEIVVISHREDLKDLETRWKPVEN